MQNIDNLFYINGNINKMRCAKQCRKMLLDYQECVAKGIIGTKETPPPNYLCPFCRKQARPHVLFQDEQLVDEYYQTNSLFTKILDFDCLILIGSDILKNDLVQNIYSMTQQSNSLIVEIAQNQPYVEVGHIYQLLGKYSEIIPDLCNTIVKTIKQKMNMENQYISS